MSLIGSGSTSTGSVPDPAPGASAPGNVEFIKSRGPIERYRLKSNGMDILLLHSGAAPVVTFLVVVRVGSRNEAPGNTGSAHLLEHMLFNKSTEHFGRDAGKTIQEVLYEAGGDFSTSNMTTWCDRITMYDTLPADQLETTMRINADRLRLGKILDEERRPEMTVVRNEYERGENDPSEALMKAVVAAAIVAHPYHWSTIGWRSDIEGVSTQKLREHYDTFFWPDNSTAILVGDFDKTKALALFERHFGGFPRAPKPIPEVHTVEPPQEGERRVVVRRAGAVALVSLAWPRPGAQDAEFPAFEILASILGDGISSRLHEALVETRLATQVSAYNWSFRDPYLLMLNATVTQGVDPAKCEGAISEVVGSIREKGVTDEEVARAQAQIEAQTAYSRDGTYGIASSLGEAVGSADWEWWIDYLDRIRAVTPAQVRAIAQKYLGPDQTTVGWFVPKKPEGGEAVAGPGAVAAPSRGAIHAPGGGGSVPPGGAAHGVSGDAAPARADGAVIPRAVPGTSPGGGSAPAGAFRHGALPHSARVFGARSSQEPGGARRGAPASSDEGIPTSGSGGAGPSATPDRSSPSQGPGMPPSGSSTPGSPDPARPSEVTRAAPGPGKGFAERAIRRVLPNGAVIVLVPSDLSDTVSLRVRLRAGSYLDGGRPGLAEATARMLSRGTAKRSKAEIARQLESVGSALAWGADVYDVAGAGACLSRNLPALLSTLAEELRQPSFDATEWDKLREEMTAEILEEDDSTSQRAFAQLSRAVYPDRHPLRAHTAKERTDALAGLRPDDLRGFHAAHYGASGLIVALCGRFDPAAVEKTLVSLFGELPKGDPTPILAPRVGLQQTRRLPVPMKDKANVDIVIGNAGGLRRTDPDYYAALLANAVLGQSGLSSRLGRQVRDTEGLTYVIVSRFFGAGLLDGTWGIYLSVAPENVERGIGSSVEVLGKFCKEGITSSELEVEKSAAAGRFLVSLSNNAGIADALAQAESSGLGISLLDEFPRKVRAVTLEEANRALRAHIHAENLVTVVAGSVPG